MSKTLMKLSAAALALCVAFPVQAQDTPAEITVDTVVATVNGTDITFGHMLMARASLPERFQGAPTAELWEGLLERLIQYEALSQSDKAEETDRVALALDNEKRELMAAEAMQTIADGAVSDEAIAEAYKTGYVDAVQGVEYNASHILVETEAKAKELVVELEGGADFAELARANSTGPTGPNGGLLGWFGKGRMVAAFEEAVATMEPGDLSAPVQTRFGWHVIKLNETRAVDAPPLEEVRAQLEQQIKQEAVQSYIKDLVESGEVTRLDYKEIDTSVINNLGLLAD
ncbi:peptidylprolyl isomerase [Antarctobacter heliothermus]|uniref:Parvulin-like PPIase n=1 Tax=Antarctobacter heliothermus TaxID=74033 RepID=A0A239H2R7_9RHOB|nr:peptidylprolyl isomerase [Antarctobacter heliothermus]SNS75328.1 peptidyl-prolyl cis-trans isomerase C [Antarctobacter heliothermus]